MYRKRFLLRSSAVVASSLVSLFPCPGKAAAAEGKLAKRLRESVLARPDLQMLIPSGLADPPSTPQERYPWKSGIVTTTFWVGEMPTSRNPVPNVTSSWDEHWAANYGGTDNPDRATRADFVPAKFVPQQNPFYIALPYNDVTRGQHKPEASKIIPWFAETFKTPGRSVLKGRWIAIRRGDRIAYAQWEDCGPFRTDHWQYVFGTERPKPNLNKGAGLDVSPAVRDFLGMNETDVTDWKFVDFKDVPQGPWAQYGENNTFVQNRRQQESALAQATLPLPTIPGQR